MLARIEARLHHFCQRPLFRIQNLVVIAHEHLGGLASIVGDELVVVLRQPNLVHLSRLPQSLKVNSFRFRDSHLLLTLAEATHQIAGVKRRAVRLADQQAVIVILFAEEILAALDVLKPLRDLVNQRNRKVLLSVAARRLRGLQDQRAFAARNLLWKWKRGKRFGENPAAFLFLLSTADEKCVWGKIGKQIVCSSLHYRGIENRFGEEIIYFYEISAALAYMGEMSTPTTHWR